jgi:SAM-dependent methyltransferase
MKSNVKYNRKFYESFVGKLYRKISGQITSLYEVFVDYRVCNTYLGKTVKSIGRESKGATNSEPMRYWALEKIFDGYNFSENDSFIDVGCAKGRALAYMEKINFTGKITGVELNPEVADTAKQWSKKYDNIEVICGDAFEIDYNDYTILFLFKPFMPDTFYSFINYLQSTLKHPIRLFYFNDIQTFDFLNERSGWTLEKRSVFFKKGAICATYWPQCYSVWTFNPDSE